VKYGLRSMVSCAMLTLLLTVVPLSASSQLLPTPLTYLLQISLSSGPCGTLNPIFNPPNSYCGNGTITSSNTGCNHILSNYMTFGGAGYAIPGTSGPAIYESNIGPIGGYLQPVVWENVTGGVEYWVTSLVNIPSVNVVLVCV